MRALIRDLEESKIREVANAGLGRTDVLAFWFGEGDEVSPEAVRAAAIDSLQRGETFYAHNLGLPELREALAAHLRGLHGEALTAQRLAITSGGVSALMVAMQALVEPGDEVIVVTPVWPNLTAQPRILGARLRTVALQPRAGQWQLDLPALLDAITPATRLLVVNAPNNPTGWTLTRDEQAAILAHCRRTGTWILADEVYSHLAYGFGPASAPHGPGSAPAAGSSVSPRMAGRIALPCAPSFLDLAHPDDRLMVVGSFSKAFLMTGWRLGWLVLPEDCTHHVGKLIEFNTSCASTFTQRAAVAALQQAPELVPRVVGHLRACRDTLVPRLQAIPGVELAQPSAGLYAFFRLPGHDDGVATAKRLVREAGLGLAPGEAFAPEAAGWLRWCFASRDPGRLVEGVDRLTRWLEQSRR